MDNIIFVEDYFFEDGYRGGAELVSAAIAEKCPVTKQKIQSKNLTKELITKYKNSTWIFGNFSGIQTKLLLEIIQNIKTYFVIEYDYKFCEHRSSTLHNLYTGECKCELTYHGKLISLFLAKAKNVFWMSEKQQETYINKFPHLKKDSNFILSALFRKKDLEQIRELSKNNIPKNDKFIIFESKNYSKNTKGCKKYAKDNNLNFEIVGNLSYRDYLKKLSRSKGLIFLPLAEDTCPRLVTEGKLLGCELILNDKVQHAKEAWFTSGVDEVYKYLENRVELFWKIIGENCDD